MAKHQYDTEMTELDFYHKVIDWIWATFLDLENNVHSSRNVDGTPHSMANVNWGKLYHLYHTNKYDTKYVSKRLGELLDDNDIVKKHGGENASQDSELRGHLVEELADVLMYYNDILLCYGISTEELKQTYISKFEE